MTERFSRFSLSRHATGSSALPVSVTRHARSRRSAYHGTTGDGTVRVWHTPTLSLLYLLHPPHDNIGDILSLAWIPTELLEDDDHAGHRRGTGMNLAGGSGTKGSTGRLYAGCQDTSIQVRRC